MSAIAITRRMAFPARAERRVGGLNPSERAALDALYLAYDPLDLRARLLRAGYRLFVRETQLRGGRRLCLSHRRAA